MIKDSPDSPEPLNKKPRVSREEDQPPDRAKGTNHGSILQIQKTLHTHRSLNPPTGPVSLLTMWTNRITAANSRKHQEFAGRANSVNNKFELYQQLKDENGCVTRARLSRHTRRDNGSDLNNLFLFTGWTFTKTARPPDDGCTDLVDPAQDEIVESNVYRNHVLTYIPKTRT